MIVDLDKAKSQLRRYDDDDDERIMLEIDKAVAIVLDYLKLAADEYEDEYGDSDYPTLVGAAILLVIENLYDRPNEDPLTDAVRSILHRHRDPALA